MWCIFHAVFSLQILLAFFACPAILSLLRSVQNYLHSSSSWLWPFWAKLLFCLWWDWNFPLLQKVLSAACAVPGGIATALAVIWSAMSCVSGSSKHEPGCEKAFLVCAESKVYWRSQQKMKMPCTSLRKNLEVSMVKLSWPNPWQCVLKANRCVKIWKWLKGWLSWACPKYQTLYS